MVRVRPRGYKYTREGLRVEDIFCHFWFMAEDFGELYMVNPR